jgi:hypothetical protein
MNPYTYTAYGLHFASEFPLPQLTPATNGKPDIKISYGEVPDFLSLPSAHGLAWQSGAGKLLLTVSGVARYLIVENREIIIQPVLGGSENEVGTFLLGSVLGALLHARRMLVLHSSVIQTKRGAALFMGISGAGKSTLLGAFLKRGYAMLADDKAGIIVNQDGIAEVLPGFPCARLTEQTVRELNYPVEGLEILPGIGKYVVPVERFCELPIPVYAAYSLNAYNQSEIRFETLPTLDAFQILNRHTYRRRFSHNAELRGAHFRTLGVLSEQARTMRVFRPDDAHRIDELADRIEEDFSR